MATKCLADIEVGQSDSAIELFYGNPRKVFENESDSDSETEETTLEQIPSNQLSNDLVQVGDSFAKAQLDGKQRHKGKNPLRRAYSLQSGELTIDRKYKPIIRIKPSLRSKLSEDQVEELKDIGMQDSLILRSLSTPCPSELDECHSECRLDARGDGERTDEQLPLHSSRVNVQISANVGTQEQELTRRGGLTNLQTTTN
ncbi:uncharacterized protein LOC134191073 isoform X2 [Corticium candelabrum]|uniref:uncharacterized protein LOC134191073 isoform X2 n=1 Tax=Corticium candelabrum TaxID=121492 RepID=UPI002E2571A3|nr:uncharacterized protein LOC134191073 isoform X2 [Corticium candelabrum]